MRTKFILFLLLITYLSMDLKAQDVHFGNQSGIAYYKMEMLKLYVHYIDSRNQLETQLTYDFPPYIYNQPFISLNWKQFYLGIQYSFHSTASRYSLEDYSGRYLLDTRMNSNSPALYFGIYMDKNEKLRFSYYTEAGLIQTKTKISESLEIDNKSIYDEDIFLRAKNLYLEPGLKLGYKYSVFVFALNIGYVFQFNGKGLYFTYYEDVYLRKYAGADPIQPGWDGFRLGIDLAINITQLGKK